MSGIGRKLLCAIMGAETAPKSIGEGPGDLLDDTVNGQSRLVTGHIQTLCDVETFNQNGPTLCRESVLAMVIKILCNIKISEMHVSRW